MVDYKGRVLKIGERVRVEQDVPSVDGMLYKHTIVKVESHSCLLYTSPSPRD